MLIVKGKLYRLQAEVVSPFAGAWVLPGFWWGPRCYKTICFILFLSAPYVLCTHIVASFSRLLCRLRYAEATYIRITIRRLASASQ